MEKSRLQRVLEGAEFYFFQDRMRRLYRVRKRKLTWDVERKDSRGEWVFEGFAVPNDRQPNTLHANNNLVGKYVEVKIDLNTVHILDNKDE